MQHWDLASVEAAVVTGAEPARFLCHRESGRLGQPVDEWIEAGTSSGAVDDQLVINQPANHVEVDHGRSPLEWHQRIGRVVATAQQPPLFTGKGHEQHCPRKRPHGLELPGNLQQHRRATGVVVGAVVDGLLARRQGVAVAVAEVVVVGPEDDNVTVKGRAVGRLSSSGQNAHDVVGVGLLPLDRHLAPNSPAIKRPALRLKGLVNLGFKLGQG